MTKFWCVLNLSSRFLSPAAGVVFSAMPSWDSSLLNFLPSLDGGKDIYGPNLILMDELDLEEPELVAIFNRHFTGGSKVG
uniref:Uncharacterized protein n=1 Tax=Rhizophora mucronata TaxID=61149 RepID=A0A2P2M2I0_RHIMU